MTQIHLLCLFIYSSVFTGVVYTQVVMVFRPALMCKPTLPGVSRVLRHINCDNKLGFTQKHVITTMFQH